MSILRKALLVLAADHKHRKRLISALLLLQLRASIRSRNRLSVADVGHPSESTWHHLYRFGSNEAFINVMGLNRAAFHKLLLAFAPHYSVKSGAGKRGRPPKLNSKRMVLGLLLHYYAGTCEIKTLCELFRMPPSTCARIIHHAEFALFQALPTLKHARIRWPSFEEQRQWARFIEDREPLVGKRFGFIDGKNYPVARPGDDNKQNSYYNGWLHRHFATSCICFGVDGRIIWMKLNCPGSWNDGEMSRSFREKLMNPLKTLDDYGVVADSAFPVAGPMLRRIVTPLKEGDLDRCDPSLRAEITAKSSAITSIRQAAEWGVGSVEKCFRRILLSLPFDDEVRRVRLENIHRLHNFRVGEMGSSQIRAVFIEGQ